MRLAEEKISVKGSIESVWAKLVDWQTWPTWDTGMGTIKFQGPLIVDAKGDLKLKDGPSVTLLITELTPPSSYTSEFAILGTRLIFGHFLTEEHNGDSIVFKTTVDAAGATAPLVIPIVKPKLTQSLPIWMANFKAQFEKAT